LGGQYPNGEETMKLVSNMLDDPSWKVRASAALSLRQIGLKAIDALPKLRERLKTAEGEEKETIGQTIEYLESLKENPPS